MHLVISQMPFAAHHLLVLANKLGTHFKSNVFEGVAYEFARQRKMAPCSSYNRTRAPPVREVVFEASELACEVNRRTARLFRPRRHPPNIFRIQYFPGPSDIPYDYQSPPTKSRPCASEGSDANYGGGRDRCGCLDVRDVNVCVQRLWTRQVGTNAGLPLYTTAKLPKRHSHRQQYATHRNRQRRRWRGIKILRMFDGLDKDVLSSVFSTMTYGDSKSVPPHEHPAHVVPTDLATFTSLINILAEHRDLAWLCRWWIK